jgi:uncharacterized protein (DUF1330 family)
MSSEAVSVLNPRSLYPTQEAFDRFMKEDDGRPVIMLNLLRYKGEAGRATYREFADLVTPLIERLGGKVIYAGDFSSPLVPDKPSGWDAILLAQYPSRATLVELASHPEYATTMAHLRESALEATVLETTVSW